MVIWRAQARKLFWGMKQPKKARQLQSKSFAALLASPHKSFAAILSSSHEIGDSKCLEITNSRCFKSPDFDYVSCVLCFESREIEI